MSTTVSGNAVSLAWGAATDAGSGVARYHVYRSTTSGFTPSATNQIATPTATWYNDVGLSVGTYYYRVSAEDGAANVGPTTNEAVGTVQSAPPPGGLVAAYNFDEPSGVAVNDKSGFGNNGTASGGPPRVAGHTAGLSAFDGVNDVVDRSGLRIAVALVRADGRGLGQADAARQHLAHRGAQGAVGRDVLGAVRTRLDRHGGARRHERDLDAKGARLTVNTWTHLAATYDGSVLALYRDGSLVSSTLASGALMTSTGALKIGGNSIWSEPFAGLIDDLRVYSRALTASEIASDMQRPV